MLHRIIDIIQKAIDSSDAKAALLIEAVRADTAEARNRQLEAMYREAIKQSVSLGQSIDKMREDAAAERVKLVGHLNTARAHVVELEKELSLLKQEASGALIAELDELRSKNKELSLENAKLKSDLWKVPDTLSGRFALKANQISARPGNHVYPIGGVEVSASPLMIWISRRVREAIEGGADAIQDPASKP